MQPHPRQDVLPGDEVLVVRLVHVPEDGDPGHSASLRQSFGLSCRHVLKILDRYLVREIAAAVRSSRCVVLTFLLMMPPILQQGEQLIAKGVDWSIVVRGC